MAKRVLVTGANTGIGKATAMALARQGMEVILGCRSRERGNAAREEIVSETGNEAVHLMILDLASLESVRNFAREVNQRFDRLDVLLNNAGITTVERETSVDGYEKVFAVNHLGPFLLTNLLLDLLKSSAPSRIVNVASSVHKNARLHLDDLQLENEWNGRRAYNNSKYMNVLFTYELARRLTDLGVTANCLNPGLVNSEFFRAYKRLPFMLKVVMKFIGKTPEEGAKTPIYLASSDDVKNVSGRYFQDRKPIDSAPGTYDPDASRTLWELSAGITGLVNNNFDN